MTSRSKTATNQPVKDANGNTIGLLWPDRRHQHSSPVSWFATPMAEDGEGKTFRTRREAIEWLRSI